MDTAAQRDTFVMVPGNPAPEGARVVWFTGVGGRALRACLAPATADPARGTVIIGPGRTEYIEKYFETARKLQEDGFAVLILDWPGQGLSARLLDEPLKGHIDRFETFMGALRNGLDAASGQLPRPYVALAHSMGGAITLGALADRVVDVKAAAFCAPMWGLKSRFRGMKYLVWAMRVTGRSGQYAQQPGPPERFEDNVVTHSRPHWQLNRELVDAAPGLELGPVTWGWLGASLSVMDRLTKPGTLREVSCPVFVASAGEEALVDNGSHAAVCEALPDCERIVVEGARHEILMELPEYQTPFWEGFGRLLDRAGI